MNHFVAVFETTLVGDSRSKPDEAVKMNLRGEYRVILERL